MQQRKSSEFVEDPFVQKLNNRFQRLEREIKEGQGLFGGQKAARLLQRLKLRAPKDVNSGKQLGITRHFGTVFYAVPVQGARPGEVQVTWREMDHLDFSGDNSKLKRTMREKTKDYDGVVRIKDKWDGKDANGNPYTEKVYGCCAIQMTIPDPDFDPDDRYLRTYDACTGGSCYSSVSSKPIPPEDDKEMAKKQTCFEKCWVYLGICCEESVTISLDVLEFMNEVPYKCRVLNCIPCCYSCVRKPLMRACSCTTSILMCTLLNTMRLVNLVTPPSMPGGLPHPHEARSHSLGDSAMLTAGSNFYNTPYVTERLSSDEATEKKKIKLFAMVRESVDSSKPIAAICTEVGFTVLEEKEGMALKAVIKKNMSEAAVLSADEVERLLNDEKLQKFLRIEQWLIQNLTSLQKTKSEFGYEALGGTLAWYRYGGGMRARELTMRLFKYEEMTKKDLLNKDTLLASFKELTVEMQFDVKEAQDLIQGLIGTWHAYSSLGEYAFNNGKTSQSIKSGAKAEQPVKAEEPIDRTETSTGGDKEL